MSRLGISLIAATLCTVAATAGAQRQSGPLDLPSAPPVVETAAAASSAARGAALLGRNIEVPAAHAAGLSPAVLETALGAVRCGVASGDLQPPPTLTVIDYSRPSTLPRLWVFEMASGRLLFTEHVAHGQNTGENMAERFSDVLESRQSSLGLFVTDTTYNGRNGYSLRLDGREPGFNGRARERAIVIHGAPYVDAAMAAKQGRLGRSWGCPALREAVARQLIDTIRGGGVVFSYYPDREWLERSRFLNCDPLLEQTPQHPGGLLVNLHPLGQ